MVSRSMCPPGGLLFSSRGVLCGGNMIPSIVCGCCSVTFKSLMRTGCLLFQPPVQAGERGATSGISPGGPRLRRAQVYRNASAKASCSSFVMPMLLAVCRHGASACVTSLIIASRRDGSIRKYGATETSASKEASGPVSSEIQVNSKQIVQLSENAELIRLIAGSYCLASFGVSTKNHPSSPAIRFCVRDSTMEDGTLRAMRVKLKPAHER